MHQTDSLIGRAKTEEAKLAAKKVYEALRFFEPVSNE